MTIQNAARALDRCMFIDRVRLAGRVWELSRLADGDAAQRDRSQHVLSLLARSIQRRDAREQNLPRPSYPNASELPVVAAKDQIAAAIRDNQVVVVCGATGSGKTTQLPKICLDLGRGVGGMIGHTQPRRIAARSVATRIAYELGGRLGGAVGYKVRFTDQVSRGTYVKVMTDGILLAETQNDRLLAQYDTLIIDEAHERSLNVDFLLGYVRQLLPKRPDLKLIITSATIDPDSFAEHFADARGRPAPVIEVSGRTYPVEVRYRPLERPRTGSRGGDEDLLEVEMETGVVQAAVELIRAERALVGAGGDPRDRDILVFLPGEREIRETADQLRGSNALRSCEVVPLYSRLSTDEQNRVLEPHSQRRIILATNVAETSLTVPGIRFVVDSGLARISRYSPRVKVQRLPIEPVSRASAQQRSGRCGRTSPGICIRLYSEEDFLARPEFTDPEILRTNLASVILRMKALRLLSADGDVASFPFIQTPSAAAVKDGYETLHELGAIDSSGELTDIGRKLARLPVDPRIGRMILASAEEQCVSDVLVIAAALSVQEPRERPTDKQDEADALHEKWRDERSDFLAYLNLWRGFSEQERKLTGSALRRWCRANMLSYVRLREWQDVHRQLIELAAEVGVAEGGRRPRVNEEVLYERVHRALLSGLISNIGTRAAGGGAPGGGRSFEYDGARGLKFAIFPGSVLFRERPKWVMAAELVRTTRLYARTVAAIQPGWIERAAAHLVARHHEEPQWSAETAQVTALETVTLWGLPIIKRRRVHYGPIDPARSRTIFIEHALVKGEYLTPGRFFEANFATQQSIQKLEEKKREPNLLADPHSRFGFYAQKVPTDVFDGPGFERWRKRAESRQPDLLVIPREQMLAPGAIEPPPEMFPDAIVIRTDGRDGAGEIRLRLEYKHKHNDPDDGITAIVPLEVLPSLEPSRFEWLVPGLLREKITEMIRALPKATRINLAPAAGYAERVIGAIGDAFGKGDMVGSVASALTQLSPAGVTISRELLAEAVRSAELPQHLRMNFHIVEQLPGKPVHLIARGRDLVKIRQDLSKQAAGAMTALPAGPFNRGDVAIWDMGDLPDRAEIRTPAGPVPVLIGLSDETVIWPARPVASGPLGAVGVRPLPLSHEIQAARSHRAGVIRLLAMDVFKEARSLVQTMPGLDRMLLQGAALVRPDAARGALAELIALEAFAQLPAERVLRVRSKSAFLEVLDLGWDRLGATARSITPLVEGIFTQHQRLRLALDDAPEPWSTAKADLEHQLSVLLLDPARAAHQSRHGERVGGEGRWLIDTPFRALERLPIYLEAAIVRLTRLPQRFDDQTRKTAEDLLARDRARMEQVLPFWSACITRLQHTGGLRSRWDESPLAQFRWEIEELRVSLFAQELGAAGGVSVKKLQRRWDAIERS